MRNKVIIHRIILLLLIATSSLALALPEADDLFNKAQSSFDIEDYQIALETIQMALELDPEKSSYHHLLGKCYGRIAEDSNFMKAISLSKKTLIAFEKAVELDKSNVQVFFVQIFYSLGR